MSSAVEWRLIGGGAPIFLTGMTFYAIYRHRLMDIGVAIRNALVYGLLAFTLSILYLIPFFANRYLLGNDSLVLDVLIGVTAATLLAASLQRIQQWIRVVVDEWLFKGRYDHEGALVRFGDRLMRTYGAEGVGKLMVQEMPIVMQAATGALYLPEGENGEYQRIACSVGLEELLPVELAVDHPLVQAIAGRRERLIKEDVAYRTVKVSRRHEIMAAFDELKSEVGVPLVNQGRVLGLLFLGERLNDNVYTLDDLKLLGALTTQAAIALDNTRLYEKMFEAKRHYETIVRHMQRGVLTVDRDMNIMTLNTTASEILGTAITEWSGCPVRELSRDIVPLLEKTLANKKDQPPEEFKIMVHGKWLPCECETSVLFDVRGRVTGALLVFQDLTQKKRFEEEVRRVDRLASVGTLAAGIAHEIKNPLVSIQTFSQLLPERHANAEFRKNFTDVMSTEVGRINKLVQGLLDFSRIRHREIGQVDVNEVMDKVLTLIGNELKKNSITLTCNLEEDLPTISADQEQIYQVFLNLLQNGIQAIEGPARCLTLTTQLGEIEDKQGAKTVIIVKIADTGSGMPSEVIDRIFDPFYTTKANGSGLGLPICHGILKDHGGLIEVESTPGEGSEFTLTLPVKSTIATGASNIKRELACKVS